MSETASVPPALAEKRRNVPGIVALVLAIIAVFVPLVVLIIGIVSVVTNPLPGVDSGWDWVRVVTFFFFGAGIAGIPGVMAVGLGIGSLFVKSAGRVAGIVAIVIGAIMTIAAIPLLPLGLLILTE